SNDCYNRQGAGRGVSRAGRNCRAGGRCQSLTCRSSWVLPNAFLTRHASEGYAACARAPGRSAREHPPRERGKGVRMARKLMHPALVTGAAVAVTVMMTAAAAGSTTPRASQAPPTTTPIKHVVVIIGENHSFDNVFATYQPPGRQ